MDSLPTDMAKLNVNKQTCVEQLLAEEAREVTSTTASLRLQFASAQNRQEKKYQNMMKQKERVKKAVQKLREDEALYEHAKAERNRLQQLLASQEPQM